MTEIATEKLDPPVSESGPADGTAAAADSPKEIGGRRQGLEPTRYGDWERNGRCIDF